MTLSSSRIFAVPYQDFRGSSREGVGAGPFRQTHLKTDTGLPKMAIRPNSVKQVEEGLKLSSFPNEAVSRDLGCS